MSYSFDSRIRYSETDESGRLSLLSMMNYLQDCSTFQSEDLGVSLSYLNERKRAWFVAAWEILVDELPRLGDRIRINTWAHSFRGIYGGRNFTIESPEGKRYITADSLWFMVDTVTGLPTKPTPEDIEGYIKAGGDRIDMPALERKLRAAGDAETGIAIPIGKHHLDTNHHVNNAHYIAMAKEALGGSFTSGRIDVQYKKAALPGDEIIPQLYRCSSDAEDGLTEEYADLVNAAGESFAIVRFRGR